METKSFTVPISAAIAAMTLALAPWVAGDAEAHGDHRPEPDACLHRCIHEYEPCARSCEKATDPDKCWMECVRRHRLCEDKCEESDTKSAHGGDHE